MPALQSVSDSSDSNSEDERTEDGSMPALRSVTDSSDSGSDSGASSEYTDSVAYGVPQETLEDRFRLWGRASERCEPRGPAQPRAHRLGDVLGNTVAALLEFFQPYPGDERVPWSDDRRDAVRFRVLSPGGENLVIEDSFFDEVTVLPLEYLRVPQFYFLEWFAGQRASSLGVKNMDTLPIHHFPIEELLADAVQQYFRDVSREDLAMEEVSINRVLREPDDLEGPDTFLIKIPMGATELRVSISEQELLNPSLDLVGWVSKRRLRCLLRENTSRNGRNGTYRHGLFGTLFTVAAKSNERGCLGSTQGQIISNIMLPGTLRNSMTL